MAIILNITLSIKEMINSATRLTGALTMAAILANPVAAQSLAAEQLNQRLQLMNSLKASFQQHIHDADGEFLQQASGRLVVKRPGMFYWHTLQPYEHVLVSDRITMWLYDVDLEQINRKPFSADLDKAPALLLSGELEEIQKHYNITVNHKSVANEPDKASGTQPGTLVEFTLTPLSDDGVFSTLTMVFGEPFIESMGLVDSFGQITTIQFSDVILNPQVADSQFTFVPPAGVDVISDEP